jgi:uncharacterized protein YjiS (DUF1127 family)
MLMLHLWRAARSVVAKGAPAARHVERSRRAPATLATLDRRTLADIGIGPGAIVSLARHVGCERLRRPPHV